MEKQRFRREELTLEDRLEELLKQLTIEEKIQCLHVEAPEIKRLGISSFYLGGEIAHGVEARHDQAFSPGEPIQTTSFTQPIGMSATWDVDLIEKAGEVAGTEARVIYEKERTGGLSRWAPTVDMERDPRWGRTEEGYGEDPYLTGKMASAYIQGLQGTDDFYLRCGATVKHFYANNVEQGRTCLSSSVDSRNQYEYYWEPFRRVIQEGRVEAVMTSYNEINGIPAITNREVLEVMKEKWGLRGHVVCDMGDLEQTVTEHKTVNTYEEAIALAIQAGVDCFNDKKELVVKAATKAFEKGLISKEEIDCAITHTLATKFRLGLYEEGLRCPYTNLNPDALNSVEHQNVCLEVAKKSIVLLKNENQMLPLHPKKNEKIAVIGPLADVWYKDWYSGIPPYSITVYEGLKQEFTEAEVFDADGIDRIKIRSGEHYLAVEEDGRCRLGGEQEAEIFEHTDWGENKHTLRACSINKYLSVAYESGKILAKKDEVFSWYVEEVFGFYEKESQQEDEPSGFIMKTFRQRPIVIDETGICFEKKEDSNETESEFAMQGLASQELIVQEATFQLEVVRDGREEAKQLAKSSDTVIAVMGCHPIISCKEEVDRTTIALPSSQRLLLQSIQQGNPNVILVLVTNVPYAITWEQENLPAILTTASGSQELGRAIAKTISGKNVPAGRLNLTWYQDDASLPSIQDYDIIRGKRTYQYFEGKVLYPFGFGQSYTEFLYRDLRVEKAEDSLLIRFVVQNVGAYDSDEVIQVFITQLESRAIRPMKQLKGFLRTCFVTGEEKEVMFRISYEELQYFDVVTGQMLVESGEYKIQAGASSEEIRLEASVWIDGVNIPRRDMTKAIRCDYYDTYETLYLHRGHDGKPCLLPEAKEVTFVDEKVSGFAVYRDCVFTYSPAEFFVDIKAEEEGSLCVWYGETQVVSLYVNKMEQFDWIAVSLLEEVPLGETLSLRLQILGQIKVVEFFFR